MLNFLMLLHSFLECLKFVMIIVIVLGWYDSDNFSQGVLRLLKPLTDVAECFAKRSNIPAEFSNNLFLILILLVDRIVVSFL